MTASPQALAAVRVALAQPFADPVNVGGIPMSRAEARALERALSTKSNLRSVPRAASADPVNPLLAGPARTLSPAAAPYMAAASFGGAVSPSVADARPADLFFPVHAVGDTHE